MFETDSPFRDIPGRVSIFDLLNAEGVVHRGQDAKIKCPYRDEKTPSFSIFRQGSRFKDHVNGDHGDIFDLWSLMHPGTDKKDAVAALAAIGGMVVKTLDPNDLPTPGGRYRSKKRPDALGDEVSSLVRSELCANLIALPGEGVPHGLLCNRKGMDMGSLMTLAAEGSIGLTDEGYLAYIMGRGVKLRPKAETSHSDHWLQGKGSECVFRGEALLAAQDRTDARLKVLLCEGESDCAVLQEEMWFRDMNRTFVLGAHGGSWVPDFRIARRYLRGREVYIIGDNDKPGDDFAKRLQDNLQEVGGCISVKAFHWDNKVENDIGEVREKNLMDSFINSLCCKNSWS